MGGVDVLRRTTSLYVVEWAEHEESPPAPEDTAEPIEVVRYVRFRIEGARRAEPRPTDSGNPEEMLGEPLF